MYVNTFLVIKHCVSTSNHMFQRRIRDKFQKMNEANFPKILRMNMSFLVNHVKSSRRAHKGKNYTKNNQYQQI